MVNKQNIMKRFELAGNDEAINMEIEHENLFEFQDMHYRYA